MIFGDMIFDSQVMDIAFETIERSDKRCFNCHRRIVGKVYQSGSMYFDSYCWQFRFINQTPEPLEQQRSSELRTYLESKDKS
jgi:hypothetical protein